MSIIYHLLSFLKTSNRKNNTKNPLHKNKKMIKLPVNYRVALNIGRNLFLRIGFFFCILQELILAVYCNRLVFLLGINYCNLWEVALN